MEVTTILSSTKTGFTLCTLALTKLVAKDSYLHEIRLVRNHHAVFLVGGEVGAKRREKMVSFWKGIMKNVREGGAVVTEKGKHGRKHDLCSSGRKHDFYSSSTL
ncbi:hypothetical protein A2U01_0007714 [Trifolium medium]|uniref:Uncharacterized protein n=1 Tax=Trifolium medium TaxID=97028 RepID=A0A392MKR1_9FABA|nr:hypothetical protein [Trifolium medium]